MLTHFTHSLVRWMGVWVTRLSAEYMKDWVKRPQGTPIGSEWGSGVPLDFKFGFKCWALSLIVWISVNYFCAKLSLGWVWLHIVCLFMYLFNSVCQSIVSVGSHLDGFACPLFKAVINWSAMSAPHNHQMHNLETKQNTNVHRILS